MKFLKKLSVYGCLLVISLLRDQYELDVRKALVAYNMGPTALNRRLTRQNFHPTSYCKKVLTQYIAYLTQKRGLFKIS